MEKISFDDSGFLIRKSDILECFTGNESMSASDTLPKSVLTAEDAIKNLKKHYKQILTDFPTLRLKNISNKFDERNIKFWYYARDEEIQFDKAIKIVKDAPFDDETPHLSLNSVPLWQLQITQFEEKTKINLIYNHALIYGRTIFDVLDIFVTYALDKELNEKLQSYKNLPVLDKFGKNNWYTKEILELGKKDPYTHLNLKKDILLNPPLNEVCENVNIQWDVDYEPISKFCKKNSVSPQGILMAIQNEAIRKYNNGRYDDVPIAVNCPVDNRGSKYATKDLKKCLFFNQLGICFIVVENETDKLQNIKNCFKALIDYLDTTHPCHQNYFTACCKKVDESFSANFPMPFYSIFASHLGLVGVDLDDVQFRVGLPMYDAKIPGVGCLYWPNFYGFHNKKTFSFVYTVPKKVPEDFINITKDTSLKYYDFIVQNVQNE